MPFDVQLTITGVQEAAAANNRAIAALQPSGALGQAIKNATIAAHRWAIIYTHVDTGALKSSHRMEVSGLYGRVFIDPGTPGFARVATRGTKITSRRQVDMSKARPAVYGAYEHARGGSHAFYGRVVGEHGQELTDLGVQVVVGGMP